MVDFKRADQEKLTKKEVLARLSMCAVGLNVCFVVTGILQERMLTMPYEGSEENTQDYFNSSYGLVFLNRLGGFIISALLFYVTNPPATNAVIYEFSFPSVSNMLSSWCQYEALKYTSFPTTVSLHSECAQGHDEWVPLFYQLTQRAAKGIGAMWRLTDSHLMGYHAREPKGFLRGSQVGTGG